MAHSNLVNRGRTRYSARGAAPSNTAESKGDHTSMNKAIVPMPPEFNLPAVSPRPSRPIVNSLAGRHHGDLSILMDREYEPLNWISVGNRGFSYPNMVRIRTPADGSCFFHAVTKAFYIPYRTGQLNGTAINRHQLIKMLRRDLAIKLAQPANPQDPQGPSNYDLLSRGQLLEFAKGVPKYSLPNMQRELNSTSAIDNVYNEFISNQLNKDIYLLDGEKHDVFVTGNDDDILYKDRHSIVILYIPGHYELVGLINGDRIETHFEPNHPFIQAIRDRLQEIRLTGNRAPQS
jgi:hypothetical protein